MSDDSRLRIEELDRVECLRLLRFGSYVGRVGFIAGGRPMVLPVNYLAEDGSVVFSTGEGSKLRSLAGGAEVVFEVDENRPLYHAGWSVLVRGTAYEVTDEGDLEQLQRGPLKSWAPHPGAHWIRITIEEISGRRLPEQ